MKKIYVRRKIDPTKSLSAMSPEVASEWHPTKNGDLKPDQFTFRSGWKVWWKCKDGHEWNSTIASRTNGVNCGICWNLKRSKKRITDKNSFVKKYPNLVLEWHPTKNSDKNPNDFSYGNKTKVWWKCLKGHEWEAQIGSRTSGRSCPFCSGNKISNLNKLSLLSPNLVAEWHPTKNGNKTPNDFSFKSQKKVWWKCLKGHEWEASISNRSGGTGCRYCAPQSSKPEMRILTELKSIFSVESRFKIHKTEIDIYIPKFKIGIEYDGNYYHMNFEEKDLNKINFLSSYNITLIRVREFPLKKLTNNDVEIKGLNLTKTDINKILDKILPYVDNEVKIQIDKYKISSSFVNEELFLKYLSYFPSPFPTGSLHTKFPEIAKEWNLSKNFPLTSENFSYGSKHKAWWKCKKGHEWQMTINSRTGTQKQSCPFCSGKKISNENQLTIKYPNLVAEWHPTKNVGLKPDDFSFGSNKKVWWKCKKGHEWLASIANRASKGSGCKFCSGWKK
jgi:very-short-patch-repair endonuclease